MKYSTLHRHVDPQGVSLALEVFDTALTRLRENPPRVFVLENTASLLALPETLAHIDVALSTLPYDWRCVVTPPAPPRPHSLRHIHHPPTSHPCLATIAPSHGCHTTPAISRPPNDPPRTDLGAQWCAPMPISETTSLDPACGGWGTAEPPSVQQGAVPVLIDPSRDCRDVQM